MQYIELSVRAEDCFDGRQRRGRSIGGGRRVGYSAGGEEGVEDISETKVNLLSFCVGSKRGVRKDGCDLLLDDCYRAEGRGRLHTGGGDHRA
jgi:hypothetical protein